MYRAAVSLACLTFFAGISFAGFGCKGKELPEYSQSIEFKEPVYEATPDARIFLLKNEVDRLETIGQYEIAYNLIKDDIDKNYSLPHLQYALYHAEKHLSNLKFLNINSSISVFAPKEKTESASEQTFVLVEKDEINEVISQYDLLRDNMKLYLKILSNTYPTNVPIEMQNEHLSVKEKAERLKENLVNARCDYISYQVISPALAKVSKELYIAIPPWYKRWYKMKDKQRIRDAIALMAHSFHNDWLYSSSEDVRIQYCDVVKALKGEIGKAEWEEYKVITTMLNSNDPSKPRGANAWWE